MKKNVLCLVLCFIALISNAQSISGIITDSEYGDPLIGASIKDLTTQQTTITNLNGEFILTGLQSGNTTIIINYIGYKVVKKEINVNGDVKIKISMEENEQMLKQHEVTGVIDLVKDRKTPVASSNITAEQVQTKLGNQEFPEIMKTTPGVYATKQGGGYGDARINLRGFNQRNTSVIINGQPINDMENGWVFWSNWQGLADVTSGIEIQRGLGASKLAVPTIGGTINIVTRATDLKEGGSLVAMVGNDGFVKTAASYSTGLNEKGWSASALIGGWRGDGWVDGTEGQGVNYLLSLGYLPNERNKINLTLLGAGQWHHQRDAWVSLAEYHSDGERFSDDFRKYNKDWGTRNGETYSLRRNFYNKPLASFNWDYYITDNLTLSTVLYGSWGRGGGTGPRGRGSFVRNTNDNSIDFDAIYANNRSGLTYSGPISEFTGQYIGSNSRTADSVNGINTGSVIRRSSINSHNWYGVISNLEYTINNWTLGVGIDGRTYEGIHYRVVNSLLGLDGYYSTGNDFSEGKIVTSRSVANPFANISNSEKIDYYNIGKVKWFGGNLLAEYSVDEYTGVIQAGLSNQNYQRVDYFDQLPHFSDKYNLIGGYVKGGFNYNINNYHNVFINAGYIARQPIFDAIFPNFANAINEAENEQIVSFELGYGFKLNDRGNLKINLYNTTWSNRYITESFNINGNDGTAVFTDVENIHQGIELEGFYEIIDGLKLNASASIGNWEYNGDVNAAIFDDGNQAKLSDTTLYLDGVKVGDAAQTTISLGLDYKIAAVKGLSVDLTWLYFDNLYADFNANDSEFFSENNNGAVKLPNYSLIDFGVTYSYKLKGKQKITARLNINNLFDTEYISESNTNIHEEAGSTIVDGLDDRNSVWYGFGTTWNFSLKYNF